ncbi:hypothetical protein TREES_T100007877 [Tupaia chinensis]|uniref:Uncharacterized protein n=1 Tax=Tupaia chinensis TaxID=246437 RepID=L9JD13_TUPCH|nr:hypothetical protein TREES_T100007877 [Tupaia chinensis]
MQSPRDASVPQALIFLSTLEPALRLHRQSLAAGKHRTTSQIRNMLNLLTPPDFPGVLCHAQCSVQDPIWSEVCAFFSSDADHHPTLPFIIPLL